MAGTQAPKVRIEGASSAPVTDESTKRASVSSATHGGHKVFVDTEPSQDVDDTPASSDAPKSSAEGGAAGSRDIPLLSRVFPGHGYAALGGSMGLLVAVLVFTIGFWRTLVVALLVTMGVALGQQLDGNPVIFRLVRRLFEEIRSTERM